MKVLSLFIRIVGILFSIVGTASIKWSASPRSGANPLILLLGLLTVTAGAWLMKFARRLVARTWAQVAARDQRTPILYLRSFTRDPAGQRTVLHEWWKKFIYLMTAIPANQATQEDQLQLAFQDIGPMKAVAKPHLILSPVGIPRVFYENGEWKPKVLEEIRRARLVVFRVGGNSKGLTWEIEQVWRHKPPVQVIYLLPAAKKEFQEFKLLFAQTLNVDLPPFKRQRRISDFSGVLYFTDRHSPQIIYFPLVWWSPPGMSFNNIAIGIKRCLEKIGYPELRMNPPIRANIKQRAFAFLYDLLIIIPVWLLLSFWLASNSHLSISDAFFKYGLFLLAGLLVFYPVVWEVFSIKGTYGKRKVSAYLSDKDHIKPTGQQMVTRHYIRLISIFPFFFVAIPFAIYAWWKDKPLLHDYCSRTRWFLSKEG
jgi:uncharacterized RDD family membrane protein YckC